MTPMNSIRVAIGMLGALDDLVTVLTAIDRGEPPHLIEAKRLASSVRRMPRAEYKRRCGYRLPLPPHLRRVED